MLKLVDSLNQGQPEGGNTMKTSTKQLSDAARGAKNLKKKLAATFPGIKFSTRSSQFAGGDSISVGWFMGPTTKQVDDICQDYQDGSFDGMQDLYENDTSKEGRAFREQNGGAKYVQTQRHYELMCGEDIREQVGRDLCKLQGVEYEGMSMRELMGDRDCDTLNTHVYRVLQQTSFTADEHYEGVKFSGEDVRHWCEVIKSSPVRHMTKEESVRVDAAQEAEDAVEGMATLKAAQRARAHAEKMRDKKRGDGEEWESWQVMVELTELVVETHLEEA
jgi:hypothetical protein